MMTTILATTMSLLQCDDVKQLYQTQSCCDHPDASLTLPECQDDTVKLDTSVLKRKAKDVSVAWDATSTMILTTSRARAPRIASL